jgi:hypothetical protein
MLTDGGLWYLNLTEFKQLFNLKREEIISEKCCFINYNLLQFTKKKALRMTISKNLVDIKNKSFITSEQL